MTSAPRAEGQRLCIDLGSGLGGASAAFVDAGWDVIRLDLDRKFRPTIQADYSMLPFRDDLRPDMILAAPDCSKFSVMSIPRYWKDGRPGAEAQAAGETVKKLLSEIYRLNPRHWVMENPNGMLKRIIGRPAAQITMCQYGAKWMKPTDLWGKFPESFIPKKCVKLFPCHEPAPRGTKLSGIQKQGTSAAERSKWPYGLSQAILEAIA